MHGIELRDQIGISGSESTLAIAMSPASHDVTDASGGVAIGDESSRGLMARLQARPTGSGGRDGVLRRARAASAGPGDRHRQDGGRHPERP